MVIGPHRQWLTVRVRENGARGRDFVVGDVHREFDSLEAVLPDIGFPTHPESVQPNDDALRPGIASRSHTAGCASSNRGGADSKLRECERSGGGSVRGTS